MGVPCSVACKKCEGKNCSNIEEPEIVEDIDNDNLFDILPQVVDDVHNACPTAESDLEGEIEVDD